MTIDELQQKFNEMLGKKWRVPKISFPVKICGFFVSSKGKPVIIVEYDGISVFLNANTLQLHGGSGEPFIEEISPYSDWQIDAKIMVWNCSENDKVARHFAGIEKDGWPMAWINGCTSHTSGITAVWSHAELAEDEKWN